MLDLLGCIGYPGFPLHPAHFWPEYAPTVHAKWMQKHPWLHGRKWPNNFFRCFEPNQRTNSQFVSLSSTSFPIMKHSRIFCGNIFFWKTYLKLFRSFRSEFGKVNSTAQENVGGFWDTIDFPSQVLEKGRQSGLTCSLSATGSACQDQFPDFPFPLLFGHNVFKVSEDLHFGRMVIVRGEKQRKWLAAFPRSAQRIS